ncbi:class I SAM-dependent methyltransferase [Desulfococcaceae bacterium HSG7]|nr:class I SAM-dependent methyltransferase [Desulfococcaceae bacterium HSG7]
MNIHSSDTHNKIWNHFQNELPDAFKDAKPRLDYLVKVISHKKKSASPKVLNIGAGDGYFETTVQRLNMRIYSLDPDEATVRRLTAKKIQAFEGYMQTMPFDNACFDFVVASEVLEHLDATQFKQGLNEVVRVLDPKGWFIGTVPYKEDMRLNRVICPDCGKQFHRWGHERTFGRSTLRSELTPYFKKIMLKRRAFATLRHCGLTMTAKNLVRLVLGPFGAPLASPNLFFTAQK